MVTEMILKKDFARSTKTGLA